MVRMEDGPAAGAAFRLRRAPLFLRLVRGRGEDWSALDQLDDAVQEYEEVAVYRRVARPTWVHVDYRRGRRGPRSEWLMLADYRVCPDQPADEVVRNTARWQAWCLEHRGDDHAGGA